MITIPFAEFPFFTQDVTLDGEAFRFRFYWSDRASRWTLSIYDLQDIALVEGIVVALDQEILGQYPSRGVPAGEMYAVDASGKLQTIGRNDLSNGNVSVIYVTSAELQ